MTVEGRRHFLRQAGAVSLGFLGLRALAACGRPTPPPEPGWGLLPDPQRMFELPPGFSYRVVSRTGVPMADGFLVPGSPDAMAAFPGPDGLTLLVRNHELTPAYARRGPFGPDNRLFRKLDPARMYDAGRGVTPGLGGTTTVVYNTRERKVERQFLSLAGTWRNCAGGPTPWKSWLTCEEAVQRAGERNWREPNSIAEKDHGYTFEVPATAAPALAEPEPLRAMGRFNHEAAAVDPRTGVVYQTEDRGDGLFYRFVPETPGRLIEGGRLQALRFRGKAAADSMNWYYCEPIPVGATIDAAWVDLEDPESPKDDLRMQGRSKGAAFFARGEGIWFGDGELFFACTNGGIRRKGQVWRYVPSPEEGKPGEEKAPGRLELFLQPDDARLIENCDNLTIAPWGDLVMCEDGPGPNYVVGVTREGSVYKLGRNVLNPYELAGCAFSPDGTTLFVNLQNPGVTLAITGPNGAMSRPGA